MATINEWINEQDAPLHYWCIVDAPAETRLAKIETALKNGHDYLVNEVDHTKDPAENRGTPLHCALDVRSARPQDNREIINLLIKYGADPIFKDGQGRTAIDMCASQETTSPELAEFWKEMLPVLQKLDRRLAPNRIDYGNPLHNFPCVPEPIGFRYPRFKAGVDAGLDVNQLDPHSSIKNHYGRPLHCVATDRAIYWEQNLPMLKLLLAHGADPRLKEIHGKYSPIDEVKTIIRMAEKDGRDTTIWKTYLGLMEEAAEKLDEKERREKDGLFGSMKRFIGSYVNRT